jgi:HK97 family phage prohead protease
MITKAIDLSVKDIDLAKREAVIAFATYKSLDLDGDRSNRGMFDKSWRENSGIVRYFLNHKKEQAPGKVEQLWDDDSHAYARVKHGTHTLGDDVLKQLDEGIIVAASFGFDPVKFKDIKGKGKDFTEVKHYEVSALTHWGAHTESGPVAVRKALSADMNFRLKSLSQTEQDLLTLLINNGMNSIQAAVEVAAQLDPDSDLYTFVMWFISRHAEIIGGLRSELRYGIKEKMDSQISKMQKFIRNTDASDECIKSLQSSLNILLHKSSDTATSTDTSLRKCPKCATYSSGITDDLGNTKCAECNHLLTKGSQPEASRNKDELRRKLLQFKAKMALADND